MQLREKAKSPRSRRLWLKPKSKTGTPQELLLEGFFLLRLGITSQWFALFDVRFVKLLSVLLKHFT